MDYVVDADRRDIEAYENDDFNLSYNISKFNENTGLWEDYDFTSHQLHMVISSGCRGVVAEYSTEGADPKIVAVNSIFVLTGNSLPRGEFDYAIYANDGTGEEFTVMYGRIKVKRRRRAA